MSALIRICLGIIILCLGTATANSNLKNYNKRQRLTSPGLRVPTDKPMSKKLVYGGVPVPVTQYPHIAQITLMTNHMCMGSILNQFTVVTAGHCFDMIFDDSLPITKDSLEVHVGSEQSRGGTNYTICKIVRHEDYYKYALAYDIALMFIDGKIKFSSKIKPIEFAPSTKWQDPKAKISVAGFGLTRDGKASSSLKAVWMNYVLPAECNRSQSMVPLSHINHGSMFCMVSDQWGSDCFGDSGSGIVWKNYIIGTVVSGLYDHCGSSVAASVYTNILYFKPWIEQHIKDFEKSSRKCDDPQLGEQKKMRANRKSKDCALTMG